jgi:hypothetical protein
MLQVGVPPPPPFPQIFVVVLGLSRFTRALPAMLHGTAGAQLTRMTAPITKSRVGRRLFLLIMALHAPFLLPRRSSGLRRIPIFLVQLETIKAFWRFVWKYVSERSCINMRVLDRCSKVQ